MYIPINLENVQILNSNFNVHNSIINDDFIEVLNYRHIKLSYVFDGICTFLPVVECKMFNTKNFILKILEKKSDFNEIDEYYFIHFSEKFSILKTNFYDVEKLSTFIVKMYFEVVKCIKYESDL